MKRNLSLFALLCFSHSLVSVVTASTGSHAVSSSPLQAHGIDDVSQEEERKYISADVGSTTAIDDAIQDDWRRSLPPGLRNEKGAPLHRIEMNNGVILYLLGSSHVSRTSCDDAKLLMQHVRPGESAEDCRLKMLLIQSLIESILVGNNEILCFHQMSSLSSYVHNG